MSAMGDLFKNEKLLEKVVTAETKEDAKKVCKEGGLEVTDAELDDVAGGLSTTAKVLIGLGATAATAGAAYGTYRLGKSKGWWCKSTAEADDGLLDPNKMHSVDGKLEKYDRVVKGKYEIQTKAYEPGGVHADDVIPNK